MLWLCIRLPRLAHEALAPERDALERLAAWAYQWSSLVSYEQADEPLLWLELGASQTLFGDPATLLARLEADLLPLGYSHACALAPTALGAALLTRLESRDVASAAQERCVLTRRQLRARLESLPLSLLALPPEVLEALQSVGLRRIGEVLSLSPAAIARRFGPQTSLYLRRLTGAASDPRPAWRPPATYRARCEFGGEVHETGALLFALQRLLLEFQGYLRGRDGAVLHFTLLLEHHRRSASRVRIGLSAPSRDAAQLLQLARERLHDLVLEAPVSALALEALEFTAPAIVQADFFGSDAQQLQQLTLLLDRLRARLGEDRIQGLECRADYRPERAWGLAAPARARARSADADTPRLPRPCALLPNPQRIEPPDVLLAGPERIESGWWDGADRARDYYVARAADGARLWVFRDLRAGDWYLHGLWT